MNFRETEKYFVIDGHQNSLLSSRRVCLFYFIQKKFSCIPSSTNTILSQRELVKDKKTCRHHFIYDLLQVPWRSLVPVLHPINATLRLKFVRSIGNCTIRVTDKDLIKSSKTCSA